MSLIGWYPLDGNLEDYSGNKRHGTGSWTVDNVGKIGKCYTKNGTITLPISPQTIGKIYSLCFWVYTNSTSTGTASLFAMENPRTSFSLFQYPTRNDFHWSCSSNQGIDSGVLVDNVWTHVTLTYDGVNLRRYYNGILKGSSPGSINVDDSRHLTINGLTGTKMNDIRIYDEALSIKEIKEIAKAKILHYNFNSSNEGVIVNLFPSDVPYSGIAHGSTGGITTEVYPPISNGGRVYKITEDGVDTQNARYSIKFNAQDLNLLDKELCLSCYVFVPAQYRDRVLGFSCEIFQNSTGVDWHGSSGYNTTSDYYGAGNIRTNSTYITYDKDRCGYWQRVSMTMKALSSRIKVTSDNNAKENNIYIAGYFRVNFSNAVSGGTPYYLYLSCPQLELGNTPTEYKTPGFRNISNIMDSSGFGHNATVTLETTPSPSKESIIGIRSVEFMAKSGQKVECANFNNVTDSITVACWAKYVASSSTDRPLVTKTTKSDSSDGWSLWDGYGEDFRWDVGLSGGNTKLSLNNTWRHLVGTYNSTTGKECLYMDGTLIRTVDRGAGTKIIENSAPLRIGYAVRGSANMSGNIADVQIFATDLSATDVMELYQSRGSVSKNGKIMVNEIIETPTGITGNTVKTLELRSIGYNTSSLLPYVKLDGTTILTGARSYSVVTISRDLLTTSGKNFDVYNSVDNATAMINHIKSINDEDYIVIVTYDHPTQNSSHLRDYLTSLGLNYKNYTWGTRDAYAAIFRKCGDILFESHEKFVSDSTPTNITYSIDLKTGNSVNKKGQLVTNEIIEVPTVNLETKTAYSADWVQLFYHNSNNGTVLFGSNKSEFLKCNTVDKISNLYLLDLFRAKDGKFELLLEYQSGGTSYNRWKQSSNFTSEPISGYEAIQCSWTANSWGGLEYNGGSSSWADGSVNISTWHYSIGQKVPYSNSTGVSGIPHWSSAEPGWVKLWVRCDNPEVFKFYKNGCTQATEFIEI